MAAEEAREVNSRAFIICGRTLKMALSLKYMGEVLSTADDDWMLVIRNLMKVQDVWS